MNNNTVSEGVEFVAYYGYGKEIRAKLHKDCPFKTGKVAMFKVLCRAMADYSTRVNANLSMIEADLLLTKEASLSKIRDRKFYVTNSVDGKLDLSMLSMEADGTIVKSYLNSSDYPPVQIAAESIQQIFEVKEFQRVV